MTIWVGATQIHAFFTLTPHPGPGLLLGTESAEFLYGIVIAIAFQRGAMRLAGLILVLGLASSICALAGCFADTGPGREVTAGIPAALVV